MSTRLACFALLIAACSADDPARLRTVASGEIRIRPVVPVQLAPADLSDIVIVPEAVGVAPRAGGFQSFAWLREAMDVPEQAPAQVAAAGGPMAVERRAPSTRAPVDAAPVTLAVANFSWRDAPRPRDFGEVVKPVAARPVAPLQPADVKAVVQAHSASLRACYERELKSGATIEGRLLIGWTVRADGNVEDVVVQEDGIGSERVASCAVRSVQGWRFPRSTEAVVVEYPFVMRPSVF
jgi:hypothetical protein